MIHLKHVLKCNIRRRYIASFPFHPYTTTTTFLCLLFTSKCPKHNNSFFVYHSHNHRNSSLKVSLLLMRPAKKPRLWSDLEKKCHLSSQPACSWVTNDWNSIGRYRTLTFLLLVMDEFKRGINMSINRLIAFPSFALNFIRYKLKQSLFPFISLYCV